MTTISNLLSSPSPPTEATTLDQTLAIAAGEWNDDILQTIVAGLREQSRLRNIAQAQGSRKLVKSKSIKTKTKPNFLKKVKL